MPEEKISTLENILRDLIERVLSDKYGADWPNHLRVSEDRVALWAERKVEESKRRPGVSVDQRLLFYSEFTDLASIIDKHWNDGFIDCFQDKGRIQFDLKRLLGYRNPVAHSRQVIVPWEQDLISGLTGLIRNEVTIYLSGRAATKDEPDFYARIEEVVDHFGNRYVGQATDKRGSGIASQRLYVGDILTLQCRGTDPQGKELYWDMHTLGASGQNFKGDIGCFDYEITNRAVGADTAFFMHLRCPEQPYSRMDIQDDDLWSFALEWTLAGRISGHIGGHIGARSAGKHREFFLLHLGVAPEPTELHLALGAGRDIYRSLQNYPICQFHFLSYLF